MLHGSIPGISGVPLAPRWRLARLIAAHALFVLASPGALVGDGSCALAVAGFALWSATVVRSGRRAFAVEWLAGALGGGALFYWCAYVVWFGPVYCGAGWGVYAACAGLAVRRMARWLPLPSAAAIGWMGVEVLRAAIPPPFGLGWLRLGHFAHHLLFLSGSARVWGVEGLGFALACLGGAAAALALRSEQRVRDLVLGVAPSALACGFALFVPAPRLEPGPAILLVQPAFLQHDKLFRDADVNFAELSDLTARAVRAASTPPDLVCWGESMYFGWAAEPAVRQALVQGLQVAPWNPPLSQADLDEMQAVEDRRVRREILGSVLPSGTSFLTGVELFDVQDGVIRSFGAVLLYDAQGRRSPPANKQWLVPGAETILGLEEFEPVREFVRRVAGYTPDFAAGERTTVLSLGGRDGASWRFGASVCFDNAFLGPYLEPLAEGPLDFHLVASNEAWYHESFEMDQMLAFSRLIALSTGRSVVRATNSGVSCVLSADGREVGRVESAGRDRSVTGWLEARVPVPADPAQRTPYLKLQLALSCLLTAGLLLTLRRASNSPPEGG
jgi:apolipoprotein N-acyltransferase